MSTWGRGRGVESIHLCTSLWLRIACAWSTRHWVSAPYVWLRVRTGDPD